MKFQTGLRVDGFVFDGFKEVCRGERMLVGDCSAFDGGLFEGWVCRFGFEE